MPKRTARKIKKCQNIGVRSSGVAVEPTGTRMPINKSHKANWSRAQTRSDVARREKFSETFGITGYADAEQMLRTEQPDSGPPRYDA